MKTDSILEDLYAVRKQLFAQAGNDFDRFFDERLTRQSAAKQQSPQVQWVDFSKSGKQFSDEKDDTAFIRDYSPL